MICPHCGREIEDTRRRSTGRVIDNLGTCGDVFLGFSGKQEKCVLPFPHAGPCESVETLQLKKPAPRSATGRQR